MAKKKSKVTPGSTSEHTADESTIASGNKWQKLAEEAEKVSVDQQVKESHDGGKESTPVGKSKAGRSAEDTSQEASVSPEIDASQEVLDFPSRDQYQKQLTAMELKHSALEEQVLRAQSELLNVRRRAERDVSNAHKFGAERLIGDLLPVIDSIIRGLEGIDPNNEQLKVMREGMQLTLDLLEQALSKHGVSMINPKKGEKFNPQEHEAMSAIDDTSVKSNGVVQVLQRGYTLNGRVLRAAMVIVAR